MPDLTKDARFWNKAARKYAADPIADEAGYERSLARTREFMKPEDAVFEFGCGTGTSALKLAPGCARLLATDLSSEMIAIAQEKAASAGFPHLTFEVGTADEARWPEGGFDFACGFNILHLVQDRGAALRGVHRLLKPGGIFISKTPCLAEMNVMIRLAVPVLQAIGKAPHVDIHSAEQLAADIEAAGFEIMANERHGSGRKDSRPFIVARKI